MKNVIVTGGAGYIGSHTCRLIQQRGFNPITFDNLFRGNQEQVLYGPFEFGDLNDREALRKVFQKYQPVAVIHLAGLIYVGESNSDPALYYKNNVVGTFNLQEVMREFKVEHIVFSSSCAVYGIPEVLPISEKTPTNPINPYGNSKLMAEKILQDFHQAYGINYVALRYFNACGASADAEIGSKYHAETHVIPLAVKAAIGQSDSFTINGDDYETKDGTCVRDYVHVEDLAEAHLQALNFLLKKNASEIFNIGIGQGFSIKEIIDVVQKISGKNFVIKNGARREGDPAQLIADNSKIKNLLGWQPKYTSIEKMVETAYNWHCKF